ncbi:MAG: hypothetical protein KDD42_06355 [Bdellovibrionales bacterium]|nr:hypothetical protein [Bdellovibrionales bacterium]
MQSSSPATEILDQLPELGQSEARTRRGRHVEVTEQQFDDLFADSLREFREKAKAEIESSQLAPETTPTVDHRRGHIVHDGRHFDSRSEAAVAAMLERYIDGFRLERGRSYQIPVKTDSNGNVLTVDFKVGDTLMEYHPAWLKVIGAQRGGFANYKEYAQYRRELEALPRGEAREDYKAEVREKLVERYYQHRRHILNQHPEYRDKPLVVVTSAEDLYNTIIRPFGKQNLPSQEQFLRKFDEVLRQAHDQSKRANRSRNARTKRQKGRGERIAQDKKNSFGRMKGPL